MSICDNTTVNQETALKLQSKRKIKTCRNACKKTFNDPRIRWSTAVLCKKSTTVPVPVQKNYLVTVPCTKVPRYCPSLLDCFFNFLVFKYVVHCVLFLPDKVCPM